MNSRNNLRRAQQWQLADRLRYLSELEALGERVRVDIGRLREEIEEAIGANALRPYTCVDPQFIRPLVDRHEKLMHSIAEIDTQIVETRATVRAAEQGMKPIEGALVHHGLGFDERLTRRARRTI